MINTYFAIALSLTIVLNIGGAIVDTIGLRIFNLIVIGVSLPLCIIFTTAAVDDYLDTPDDKD